MSKNSLYLMNFNNHAILSHQYLFLIMDATKQKNLDRILGNVLP